MFCKHLIFVKKKPTPGRLCMRKNPLTKGLKSQTVIHNNNKVIDVKNHVNNLGFFLKDSDKIYFYPNAKIDSQTDGQKDGMTDGRVKATYLLCYHREHFQFDTVELVKARPSSGRGKTLEELKETKGKILIYSQYSCTSILRCKTRYV